jgi:hypothetical protein
MVDHFILMCFPLKKLPQHGVILELSMIPKNFEKSNWTQLHLRSSRHFCQDRCHGAKEELTTKGPHHYNASQRWFQS